VKRMLYRVLVLLLFVGLMMGASTTAQAASEKSDGNNMKKVLSYYKQGKYSAASKYCKKLNKNAKEACVKKMSKGMKKAYKKIVKKYPVSTASFSDPYLWGYYLTDMDNDKKADLIVQIGTCEADARAYVYQYKKGKAVKVATLAGGHVVYYAYPKHNGIVMLWGHMGYESVSVAKLKNGKVTSEAIGSREINYQKGGSFLPLGCKLDDHVDYDSSYKRKVDFSPFK